MKKKHIIFIILIISILFFLMTSGCPPTKKELRNLVRLDSSEYPSFYDDMDYTGLEEGIMQSLTYLNRIPGKRVFQFGDHSVTADHIIRSLKFFSDFIQKKPTSKKLEHFIKSNYWVYQSIGRDQKGEVLFTGYYEPILQGSLQRTSEYRFPIYGPPNDMSIVDLSLFSSKFQGEKIIGRVMGNTFVPYYERQEIEEEGVLEDKAEPLAWVKDRVALFFLHIQGSGKIALNNGKIINVHYHSKNGRPYKSIGQFLIDKKKISVAEMSMQKIREYLKEHPEETGTVLNYNPSYIFFSKEEDGPFGALNVRLTPGRSLAVDRGIFPLSPLAFVRTQKPLVDEDGNILSWKDFGRFVLTQDTGGAIRGPGRADLFWGNGKYPEIAAGHMKHTGELYLLILRPDK
jgi:membrane-bound lytic murein transglycosylase A